MQRVRQAPTRLFDALASMRLAVTVMAALAAACVAATFYESKHGTAAAQRAFYHTGWFTLLVALLGLNILFAMMKRYPWSRHHAGFVLAHVGILLVLGGSIVSLQWGIDGSMALYEGETGDRITLGGQALGAVLPDHSVHATFPLPAEVAGRRFAMGSSIELVTEVWLPHVEVRERLVAGKDPNPALHFVLAGSFGKQDGWLVADDRERSHVAFGPVTFGLHTAPDAVQAAEMTRDLHGANNFSFAAAPDGTLLYGLAGREGKAQHGTVRVGEPIRTPWMDLTITVDEYLPRAATERAVAPAPTPARESAQQPAIRVRLEGPPGRSPSEWLLWNETREIAFAGGHASVSYRPTQAAVPFRVTLLDFDSEKYPGSTMAATYESRVRVDDPERGTSEHLISMNRPLHYRGYTFFQASYAEGEPMMSIFSVSRAPGLPVVYLGTALISIGTLWMFALKSWLARRQGRRALAALAVGAAPAPAR